MRVQILKAMLGYALMFMLGCSPQGSDVKDKDNKAITVTDALGKEVRISLPVNRIVVANSDAAEILCALGVEDKIVGVSDHILKKGTTLLPELKEKSNVGSGMKPNPEKIIELKADLVIAYDIWPSVEELEEKLKPVRIPVIRIPCYRIDRLAEDICILGKIVQQEEKAEEFIQYYQRYIKIIQNRLKGLKKRVRVYAELYSPYRSVAPGSGTHQMLELACVENIAKDESIPYPTVTPEWIMVANPGVIINAVGTTWLDTGYGTSDLESTKDFLKAFVNRPGWNQIKAVKEGRVYLISPEIWTGPRSAIGILYIAKWCYPKEFRDIDPEAIHREWLRRFYQKELKGIYVYPQ